MLNPKQEFCLFDSSGKAIGVIAPSIFHALVDGKTVIDGPAGSFQISEQTPLALEQGLRLAGALIPGSPDEVKAVSDLLHDPATSRTTSFFLCKAKTCADLLNDMRIIKSSKVFVIGCGGIGSSLALLLAGSGIKNLTLADADIIESSNLNRQLFWRKKDIGRAKTDTLQREINDRFEDIKTKTIRAELSYNEIIELSKSNHFSAIAITADNPPTLVSRAKEIAATLKIPVVSGGYLHSHCTAYFFSGKDNLHTIADAPCATPWQRLPHAIMPSFGPLNFNISALLASGILTSIATNSFGEQRSHYIEWNAAQSPLEYATHYFEETQEVV
ncbi:MULTISPECIES: ThiF family adenylyltransferase [Pseudomonas]|uniref:ThiF family adenylyltransferase n=1 Tax=Pseudomonas TaxID=286 RepID=UPI00398FDE96